MSSFIRKSIGAVRQYQFGIFKILLNRLLPDSFKYQSLLVYTYDLQKEIPEASKSNPAVKISRVEDPDDEVFKKFRKKYPAREFLSRIKKDKETAYIATKNGEVIAYAWITENEIFLNSINYNFSLDNDEVFLYSCYVSREHRGEGIHTLLIHERLRDYIQRNSYKTAYVGVLSNNKGSIKGIEKAGFKQSGRITYLKVLGIEKWWRLEQPALAV